MNSKAGGRVREIPVKRRKCNRKCFFDLPAEIRQKIYELYFDDNDNYRPYWNVRQHYNPYLNLDIEEESETEGEGVTEESEDDDEDPYGDNYRSIIRNVHRWDLSIGRSEIVINQAGYLHTNVPMLCVGNRALFSETWQFIYGEDALLVVHVNDLAIAQAFNKNMGILKILGEVRTFTAIEDRTCVVLHGAYDSRTRHEGGLFEDSMATHNLKEWLLSYWNGETPLFDTKLQLMRVKDTSIGGKSYGWAESHPPERSNDTIFRQCLGVVKYLRTLHRADTVIWRHWTTRLVQNILLFETRGDAMGLGYTADEDDEDKESESDLVDKMLDAVVRYTELYNRRGRTLRVEMYLAYFAKLQQKVKDTVGESVFEQLEEAHLQSFSGQ
ncbi:hypothetical protein BDV96DRAFT_116436 [Lophiotrema nucula]|uniref:Uncharacterized protein n=1 Tax=Lophiotrema nucula TaxID=690887 RepID=A0A6A5Z2N7_9PLEO|nr:hypothetical protein BDV96DRAFT_116436 [Lophiotrema nucula]